MFLYTGNVIKLPPERICHAVAWSFTAKYFLVIYSINEKFYISIYTDNRSLLQNKELNSSENLTITKWFNDDSIITGWDNGEIIVIYLFNNEILIYKLKEHNSIITSIFCFKDLLYSGDNNGNLVEWIKKDKYSFKKKIDLKKNILNILSLAAKFWIIRQNIFNLYIILKDSIVVIKEQLIVFSVPFNGIHKTSISLNSYLCLATDQEFVLYNVDHTISKLFHFSINQSPSIYSLIPVCLQTIVIVSGSNYIEFLDLQFFNKTYLHLPNDLIKKDDKIVSADHVKRGSLLTCGTIQGNVLLWQLAYAKADPSQVTWELIYRTTLQSIIKNIQSSKSVELNGNQLLIMMPRKVVMLEQTMIPTVFKGQVAISYSSYHPSSLFYQTLSKDKKFSDKDEFTHRLRHIKGFQYDGDSVLVIWDASQFYFYRFEIQAKTFQLLTSIAYPSKNLLAVKCVIYQNLMFVMFREISRNNTNHVFYLSTNYVDSIHMESQEEEKGLEWFTLGHGVQGFDLHFDTLSTYDSKNLIKCYKLKSKNKAPFSKILLDKILLCPDFQKTFSQFAESEWRLAEVKNNVDSRFFSLIFETIALRDVGATKYNTLIIWQVESDLIFPLDISNIFEQTGLIFNFDEKSLIKNLGTSYYVTGHHWDAKFPSLFGLIFCASNESMLPRQFFAKIITSSTASVNLMEMGSLSSNPWFDPVVRMEFPFVYCLKNSELIQDKEVYQTDDDIIEIKTFNTILDIHLTHSEILIDSKFDTDNEKKPNLITYNHPLIYDKLESVDWAYLFKGITCVVLEEWKLLYGWLYACKENSFYGHLAKFCLHYGYLKMAAMCLRKYMTLEGYRSFEFFTQNLINKLPPDSPNYDDMEPMKIAIYFAFLGYRDDAIDILKELIKSRNKGALYLYGLWAHSLPSNDSLNIIEKSTKDGVPLSDIIRPTIDDKIRETHFSSLTLGNFNYNLARTAKINLVYSSENESLIGDMRALMRHHVPEPDDVSTNSDYHISNFVRFVLTKCGHNVGAKEICSFLPTLLRQNNILTIDEGTSEKFNCVQNLMANVSIDENDCDENEYRVLKTNQNSLNEWVAQYLESQGLYDLALGYYEKIEDVLSIVKMFCKMGRLDKAVILAQKYENEAAFFYLGQKCEAKGDMLSAIKFFTFADAYSIAFKLCKAYNMEERLFELAQDFPLVHKLEIAKYFERKEGYGSKAETLYKSIGNREKALEMAVKTSNIDTLNQMMDAIDPNTDRKLVQSVIDIFVSHNQIEKSIRIYLKIGEESQAIQLCVDKLPNFVNQLTDLLMIRTTEGENLINRFRELERDTKSFTKLALCATKTGNHQTACKIYNSILGDKIEAMKCLIKSGDIPQILLFSRLAKRPQIYIMAANYLQTTDNWQTQPEIFKTIVENYTKAKAYVQLVTFFESYAQDKIDKNDYSQALTILLQALKFVPKVKEFDSNQEDNSTKETHESRLRREIELSRNFMRAQKCLMDNDPNLLKICQELLETFGANDRIKGDLRVAIKKQEIFKLMLLYHVKNEELDKAKSIFDEMKIFCNKNGIDMKLLLENDMIIKFEHLK
ncbi:uncharacterized protein LOC135926453 isoform X1 [Gordionus sp. m RMFG-2023]|uniref:uncharacterized protein LOC135926453 isoform X1 n=2 Tax=Gordionus sp. m RMFG-2023 TaxID=3053472 RepID=UPI0031FBE8F0